MLGAGRNTLLLPRRRISIMMASLLIAVLLTQNSHTALSRSQDSSATPHVRPQATGDLTWVLGPGTWVSQEPRTASVRVYPDRSGLLERADELGAAGKWAEVVEIYAAALASDRDAVVAAGVPKPAIESVRRIFPERLVG